MYFFSTQKPSKPNTVMFKILWGYGTLKHGDVHENFNFLEIQNRSRQKHFETILPNFHLDECEI